MNNNQRTNGFTLIELMITLAIITILAGIGWPTYQGYIAKGHRADAIIAITKAQGLLENCYSKTRDYADSSCALPSAIATPPAPNNHYQISYTSSASDNYTITATATAAHINDAKCTVLTLASTGAKASQDNTTAATTGCWPK